MNLQQANEQDTDFKVGFLTRIDEPLLALTLEAAFANGITNSVVICDSKLMSEKDLKIWRERTGNAFKEFESSDALYKFGSAMLPFYFVDSHNSSQTLDLISALGLHCLFNAGTPRKLTHTIINSVEHGVVNVHPGILPNYRGCSCVEWAILNDDKVGNTAHFMDEDYDTGSIITSEGYDFPKNARYQTIRTTIYREGCHLAGRVLASIKKHKIRPIDGQLQTAASGTYWPPISVDEMATVLQKLDASEYRYQIL